MREGDRLPVARSLNPCLPPLDSDLRPDFQAALGFGVVSGTVGHQTVRPHVHGKDVAKTVGRRDLHSIVRSEANADGVDEGGVAAWGFYGRREWWDGEAEALLEPEVNTRLVADLERK